MEISTGMRSFHFHDFFREQLKPNLEGPGTSKNYQVERTFFFPASRGLSRRDKMKREDRNAFYFASSWETSASRETFSNRNSRGDPFNQNFRKFRSKTEGAFHYAKATSQGSVRIPRKMERHFPIKPSQPIGMARIIFYSFSEFPNGIEGRISVGIFRPK